MKEKSKIKKRYFYTYKIILLKGSLIGKYYYGQHITYNLNDNYCGSGAIVRDYYKKYKAIEGVTYTKEILKFYSNASELEIAETKLVGDLWKTDPNCLNLKQGGKINPFYNKQHTEESVNKMKRSHKGQMPTNLEQLKCLGHEKSPAVDQYDKNGNFIKRWNHMVDAAKELKIDKSSILKVLKGKRVRAGNFVWRYVGDPFNKYRIIDKECKFLSAIPFKEHSLKIRKPVMQYTFKGDFIKRYDSAADAERDLKIDRSSIGAVCQNKRKTAGGYIWKFAQ